MLTRLAIAVIACAGLGLFGSARAATSIPLPESGFALASNNGNGADSITSPMSGDEGGGMRGADRTARPDDSSDEPVRERAAPDVAASSAARTEHAHTAANADTSGTTPSTTARKTRGNAHWQSLLPGLMK